MIRKLEEFTREVVEMDNISYEMKEAEKLLDKEEPKLKKKEMYDPLTDFIPYDEIKS